MFSDEDTIMLTSAYRRPVLAVPHIAARILPHRLVLTGTVAGALLLYAYTTARYGHTFRTVDGYLYYTHAHSWYFDRDCDYENNIRYAPGFGARESFLQRSPLGRVRNVLPCAWSVVAMPGVFAADLLTALHNTVREPELARDGYTAYYRVVVPLVHVLVGVAGLLFTYAVLARYFPKTIAALAVAATWCGGNVLYYVSVDPTMAHAASMGFVAGMIWTADTIRRDGWTVRRAVLLGVCCGMMTAVRHQNIAWTAVPVVLLAPSFVWGKGILAIAIAALCFVPQVAVNLATEGAVIGHVTHWSPDWLAPDYAREMFSRSTGLLTHYPLVGLSLVGLGVFVYRHRRSVFPWAILAGFAAISYINACWWCVPSARRYVCCMVAFSLGTAAVFRWASRSRTRTAAVGLVVLVLCIQSVATALDPATATI